MAPCLSLEVIKTFVPVLAAAAAASIAVVSWIAKLLVSYLAWLFARRQQRIDLMIAIMSEVSTNLGSDEGGGEAGLANSGANDFGPVPYIASTNEPPLLTSLTDRFLLLPEGVSQFIFKYYNLSQALDAQIKDFRSEEFRKLGISRQRPIYANMIKLAQSTVAAGRQARDELRLAIGREGRRQYAEPFVAVALAILVVATVVRQAPKWVSPAVKWVSSCPAPAVPGTLPPTLIR